VDANDKSDEQLADLALRRRTEVSRFGRFMRSNGVDNNGSGAGDALTVLMKCVVGWLVGLCVCGCEEVWLGGWWLFPPPPPRLERGEAGLT
jgi:hypothetical protein